MTTTRQQSTRGVTITNLWQSAKVPVDNATDYFDGVVMVEPPETGADLPAYELPALACQTYARTATLDYAMVLEGEIWAILDTGKDCCESTTRLSNEAPCTPGRTVRTNPPCYSSCFSTQKRCQKLPPDSFQLAS